MSFKTASAILRGKWLLNKHWANAHLPIVANLLKGEAVDFGTSKNFLHENKSTGLCAYYAGGKTVYGISPGADVSRMQNDSIGVISISGPLMKEGDICSNGMVDYTSLINNLANAGNVSGIILNIDSPGGQADGTAMLSDAIKNASNLKPVLAIIDDGMAASAAMWIASAANEIYVSQPTDQVGSIGVYTTIADWASYYESQGLKMMDIYAPQSTEKNKPYSDALNGDTSLISEELAVLADQFIITVSNNRGGKIKGDRWKSGKMFFAAEAKSIGLIDGIKSFDQVVKRISSLITKQSQLNNNIMAFEKTLATAKAAAFEVTDEGFLLSEEQLNHVEVALATIDNTEIIVTKLNAANEKVHELETALAAAQINEQALGGQLITLQAEVVRFGKQPSGTGSNVAGSAIETDAALVPNYLDDNSPINQYADKHMKKKKLSA